VSKSKPVTKTTSATSSSTVPSWLTDAAQSIASGAVNLPNYAPYTGQGAAPLAGNQRTAIDYVNGLLGNAGNTINLGVPGATNAANFRAPQITTAGVNADTQGLLNPYTQDVVDRTNSEIDRSRVMAQQANDSVAGGAHVYGGDRAGVVQAENDRNFNAIKANTDAKLYGDQFTAAQNTALGIGSANQNAAIGGAGVNVMGANALTGAGTGLAGANTSDINGLLTTGGVDQATMQNADTFNYQNYLTSWQNALARLQAQSGAVSALPHDTSQTGNGTEQSQVYSNALGPILGLGLGLAGLGTGGGATLGGAAINGLFGGSKTA
jgi:hypothetical protein